MEPTRMKQKKIFRLLKKQHRRLPLQLVPQACAVNKNVFLVDLLC